MAEVSSARISLADLLTGENLSSALSMTEESLAAQTAELSLRDDFDPSTAKKKPKKVVFEGAEDVAAEGEAPALAAAGGEEEDIEALFATKKKKKKSKSAAVDDAEGSGAPMPVAEGEGEGELDFGAKKKKKKRDVGFMDAELQEGAAVPEGSGDEDDADEDAGQGGPGAEEGPRMRAAYEEGHEPWLSNPSRDYAYPELLTRFYHILLRHNPELGTGERKRYTIVPPSVHREGSKKTVFANVAEIARRMNRPAEHVIMFLFTELGTQGSVDAEQRLVIRGRFQPKQIENVLRRYIIEYVTCKTCKSAQTQMVKENRLFFMQCESCGSTRSVQAIKSGFMAQVGRRPRA